MKTRIVKIEYPNKKTWYQIQERNWLIGWLWWSPVWDHKFYSTLEEAAEAIWRYDGTKPKVTVVAKTH